MSLYNVLFNRSKVENPARISFKNIKKFIQGTYFKIVLKIPYLKDRLVKQSRIEQMNWRRELVKVKSPECATKNECYCGCDLEGLIAADPECEQKHHCFPRMMNTQDWINFKLKNKI